MNHGSCEIWVQWENVKHNKINMTCEPNLKQKGWVENKKSSIKKTISLNIITNKFGSHSLFIIIWNSHSSICEINLNNYP